MPVISKPWHVALLSGDVDATANVVLQKVALILPFFAWFQ